jgi:hypothetical protein
MQADPVAPAAVPGVPAADEAAGGGPVIRGRAAQWTAADSPAEAAVPALDAPQPAEPQTAEPQTAEPQTAEPEPEPEPEPIESEVSEQNAGAAVVTEPRPVGAEAVDTDLTEMTQPQIATDAAEAAEADEQPTEAARDSSTEAPAAAGSTRAAKRSAR